MRINQKTIQFNKVCLAIAGLLFILAGCTRHSEMQDVGADFFQGTWVQDSIGGHDEMLNYTLHEFKITCDSMYVTMNVHNKVKTIADSCYGDGNWKEYAKAVYVLRGDSILAEGIFTKSNGKQKISGCYRSGPYNPKFKVVSIGKDSLVLENRFDTRPIILRKTGDITCVPKKRWEM